MLAVMRMRIFFIFPSYHIWNAHRHNKLILVSDESSEHRKAGLGIDMNITELIQEASPKDYKIQHDRRVGKKT